MVCGHKLPTVVSNYGQSQNKQAIQTTISNATVMTVFLSKMGKRDIISKQRKYRFSIYCIVSQSQMIDRIFHRQQSGNLT